MEKTKYVRPGLTAFRDCGSPQIAASEVVEEWVGDLSDLMDEVLSVPNPVWTAQEAYDLLALIGKLSRVRQNVLAECDTEGDLTRAEQTLFTEGKALATAALKVPNALGWLEEVRNLQRSYEETFEAFTPESRAELARKLLTDLDDANLVCCMAAKYGAPDHELEMELEPCNAFFRENADYFLSACVYVEAVGRAMEPDLEKRDYGFAKTAHLYVAFLDRAEEAQAMA